MQPCGAHYPLVNTTYPEPHDSHFSPDANDSHTQPHSLSINSHLPLPLHYLVPVTQIGLKHLSPTTSYPGIQRPHVLP